MKNLDLNELIVKIAKSQDKASFNRIFDYFSPRVMGYLINSGTNRAISEEITQEVLSAVWQKAYQFDQKVANVSTWIFTIARNKRIDRIRKNENPNYNSTDLIDSLYSNNSAQNEEIKSEVDVILSALSKNEQKLLMHQNISKNTENTLNFAKVRQNLL